METLTLGLFCASLLLCVLTGRSILYALALGLVIFLLYGRSKGFRWKELGQTVFESVRAVRNILMTFILIGILTALWRAAGTIPVIVCWAARILRPSLFLVMTFLMNCLVSFLTGTALGTAATMGVICSSIAAAMQIDIALVGGAVLSGIYFGDRCSPMSTSALLVADLTRTNLFHNIRAMIRSANIPFCAVCAIYTGLGALGIQTKAVPNLEALFCREFQLHWVEVLPAVIVLGMSLLRIDVKATMAASSLSAVLICVFMQHTAVSALPRLVWEGYRASNQEVALWIDGGGILAMAKVMAIVCLSTAYSGIFQKTELLARAKYGICALSRRIGPYTTTLCTAIAVGLLTCNQAMTIIMTYQLCDEAEDNKNALALHLEDTAVIVAPLIPWSIACAVPLASINGSPACVLFAFFLYLLPIWNCALEMRELYICSR